jgi:hypothetical protein
MQGFTSLTIPTGATSGKRVVIGDPVTGNALEVYNSFNQLVLSVDSFGTLNSIDPGGGFVLGLAESVMLLDTVAGEPAPGSINQTFSPVADMNISSGFTSFGGAASSLDLLGSTGVGTNNETVTGTQRGGVTGSLLQSDQTGVNNLVHMGTYVGTTNPSGHLIIPHGCSFTPKGCVVVGNAPGTFANLTCGVNFNGFTSTNFDTSWTNAATGTPFANSTITMYALLWG